MSENTIVDVAHRVDYSKTETPPNYKCFKCGVTGVKLWREYQTFLEHQSLLCACCAAKTANEDISDIDSEGRHTSDLGKSDQIGYYIPAVPTKENDTYWGYTSVPEEGCIWWRRLLTFPMPKN